MSIQVEKNTGHFVNKNIECCFHGNFSTKQQQTKIVNRSFTGIHYNNTVVLFVFSIDDFSRSFLPYPILCS